MEERVAKTKDSLIKEVSSSRNPKHAQDKIKSQMDQLRLVMFSDVVKLSKVQTLQQTLSQTHHYVITHHRLTIHHRNTQTRHSSPHITHSPFITATHRLAIHHHISHTHHSSPHVTAVQGSNRGRCTAAGDSRNTGRGQH